MRGMKAIAAIAALLFSGTAFAGAPGWTISESSGTVTVVKGGISKIAARGGALSTGDLVTTSVNGRAVLVRGQEYLVVSPGSRIRIADPAASGGFTQIIQDFGNAIFRIKKKSTPHFAVETPYLAAVVKGTTFSVTVSATGTAVQVTEGLVQVSTNDGGASHLVRPGDIGLVEAANPLRLSIKGKDARVIDSPNPPTVKAAPAAKIAAAATEAFEAVATSEAPKDIKPADVSSPSVSAVNTSGASLFDTVIGAPVTEGAVNLASVSGGLVQGNSMLLSERLIVLEPVAPLPLPSSQAPVEETLTAISVTTTPPIDVSTGVTTEAPASAGSGTPVQVAAVVDEPILIALPPTMVPLPPLLDAPAPAPATATDPAPGALVTPMAPGAVVGSGLAGPTQPESPLVSVPDVLLDPGASSIPTPPSASPGSNCAGVPNCNGSTYTGPPNVPNGSSCAGVPNCNGAAFNGNSNVGANVSNGNANGQNANGQNGNGNGVGNNGNGNNGNGQNANGQNGNGNGVGNNGNGNGNSNNQGGNNQGQNGAP
ncbi:MAG: FecR domain-containing protein [Sphingomonadaceae bacterium]